MSVCFVLKQISHKSATHPSPISSLYAKSLKTCKQSEISFMNQAEQQQVYTNV